MKEMLAQAAEARRQGQAFATAAPHASASASRGEAAVRTRGPGRPPPRQATKMAVVLKPYDISKDMVAKMETHSKFMHNRYAQLQHLVNQGISDTGGVELVASR
eukprot:9224502-Alexandrium_andersonii.AAC.1